MAAHGRLQEGLIAALATPLGQSALAVIRTSGPGCLSVMARAFSRPDALLSAAGRQMVHGWLRQPESGEAVDEVMLGVFRAPKSYTGEDMVEIYAHGSVPGIDRIFELLFGLGFRQAGGGEFTLRAFLNGKLDLTRAEAIQEIISAQSRTAQGLALHRLGGAVQGRIEGIKQQLVGHLAAVSLQLDYPEDEIDPLDLAPAAFDAPVAALDALAASYQSGRLYQYAIRLALAGRTNAGKSSLFNALVREERAMVSEIHGTTRDWLEAPFTFRGVPVRLFDTAGLREVAEILEAEGIRRSGQVIDSAALVLYVIDGSAPRAEPLAGCLHPDDRRHIAAIMERNIPVMLAWNKMDAPDAAPVPGEAELAACLGTPVGAIRAAGVSARTLEGLDGLLDAVAGHILGGARAEDGQVLIDSERQYRLIIRAAGALRLVWQGLAGGLSLDLVALDLQDAVAALGEITGEVSSDELLENMFSNFCVGK